MEKPNILKRMMSLLLAVIMIFEMIPAAAVTAYAASGTLTMTSTGLEASYSGSGTWSGGGTTVSGTVSGKNGFISALNSAQTATLTFTNGRDKSATLSFSYNITKNTGSVTIGGATKTGSGTYEVALEAGDKIQIAIKSGKGASNTTAINLSDIALVVDSSATTTFKAPENGSYTVNGEAVTADMKKTQQSTEAYTLEATPANGYKLLGWYNEDLNVYFSDNKTTTLNVENDTVVYPVFVSNSAAVFSVGTGYYTADFKDAIAKAQNGEAKQITLTMSGSLPAGEYTIPSGVNLLIPYNDAHTASFGDETECTMDTGLTPSMYSCLTLEKGAVINCFGNINVNAQQLALSTRHTGSVAGPYGAIDMESGSQINMKSGSNLYAYGYIGGEGLVWAESGSNVYQLFQIEDWRGGNDSATLISTLKNNSFLFSQYYLQNIEANLRLDSGCTMYGSAAIAAGLLTKTPNQTCAAIVGKDTGMFHVTSGYATMKYDATTDRMNLDFYGNLVTDAISMSMNLSGLASSSMNTKDYILALPMNYTINVKSGSTITFAQKFKALPGTVINIEEGANATISSDGALYLYDKNDWNSGTFAYDKEIYQLKYVYAKKGAPVTRTVDNDAVLNVNGTFNANGPVYSTKHVTNGGNAGITGTGTFSSTVYGTTDLKEVVTSNETDLTTITCVPVVGMLAGYEGQPSFGMGTYKTTNDKWYQYTLSGTGFELVSGAEVIGDKIYVAGIKDTPASVVVTADAPCVTATNAAVAKSEDGTYTISDFTGEAKVNTAEHKEETVAEKEPTCTETGLTEGTVCTVCDEILTEQKTIDALGHTEETIPGKEPTCTETGLTEGTKCTVCDKTLTAQEIIPALGHTEENIPAVVPTCTETGLTEGKKCTVCGEILVKQEVVVALGHDHSVVVGGTYKAPTCTVDGNEADMKCARCDDTVEGAVIPATGHNHSIVIEGSSVAPTCTKDGKELDFKCANCDDVKPGATIPATGHDEVIDAATAPTCTETGLTEGKHCEICKAVLVAQETVEALGHNHVGVVTAPTCTEQGYTTYTCSRCGDSYVDDYTDPVGENHNYTKEEVVAPTCTDKGYTAKVCELCGHKEKIEGTEKPAYGHTFKYGVQTPTCTEGGFTTRTCEECGYSDTVDVVDPLGHDCVPTITYPTCTEQGYTTHKCSRCDYTHVPADSYKPAYGHQFEMAVLTPTCTEHGHTEYECMDCGYKYINEKSYVDATGHQYSENVVAPTCVTEGYTEFICYCGHSYIDNYIAANGHSYGEWVTVTEPTCTTDGEKERTCTVCDYVDTETLKATGHNYNATVVAPTCIENGYTLHTCDCGDSYKDNEKEATGHTEVIDKAIEATCSQTGLTEGKHCSVCGEILVAQEEIAMLEHKWSDWSISKLPSCSAEGEDVRTCPDCYATETRTVAKTEHTVVVDPAVAPRYDKEGLTEGKHCSVCNETIVAQEKIAKLVLDWNSFLTSMEHLERYAKEYAASNPGKDSIKLMINFIRTGVEDYTDDSWTTMAGAPETSFINEVLAKDDINGTHAYALRCLPETIIAPNGEEMEFGHLFGALNVSSNNKYTQNYTDFGSWAGDLCDLLWYAYSGNISTEDFDKAVEDITNNYLGVDSDMESGFGILDIRADIDVFSIVDSIKAGEKSLTKIFTEYYTKTLNATQRAAYFLNTRFRGNLTKDSVRTAIYNAYSSHVLIQILESDRGIQNEGALREASCYAFADYLYEQAKDKLVAPETPDETPGEEEEAKVYNVIKSTVSNIAPGVTQGTYQALDAKGNQFMYYTAIADIRRDDVSVYANYANNDPSKGWEMSKVSRQMQAAQDRHSDPTDTENYIPNYNVVASQNANFYDMSTGKPIGVLYMEGVKYSDFSKDNTKNMFAILKDGTPVIATASEYDSYKDNIQEAVAGSVILVKDGVNMIDPTITHKYPRSCVGITANGQIMMLVVDGSQAPISVGATYYEVAQIMIDAGCVMALELDGGGSATFVAKPEGSDTFKVVNRPSDSNERAVSSSLMIVSTAFVSKEFDHAIVNTPTDYITPGSSFDVELIGVSASNNAAEIPEGAYLTVSDESVGSIDGNTFTAKARGKVYIQLVLDGEVVGEKEIEVIRRPDALKFTGNNLNLIYGVPEDLPLTATYNNKAVTINTDDVIFELSNETAGTVDGFVFTGNKDSGIRNVVVTAKVKTEVNTTASISLRLYAEDESIFDFSNATAGNESLAWNRVVTNTMTRDNKLYYVVDKDADTYAEYTFAIDMKAIKAPARLQPLMEYLSGFADAGEDATPWDYMLALGGRVSELTNVTVKATFPEGVEVDLSDISFVNDFLSYKEHKFDENTRTLTVYCTWNKAGSAEEGIDPATANSIAILSGVKLTPTEEAMDKGELNIDVTGDVTYDIYLRASSLYSFAQDPANQEKYNLYDYVNPNNADDKGGHFGDTYITFEDHFTIYNEALNGWVTGGVDNDLRYYYVNNEMVTGVYLAKDMEGSNNSYYYNFGEDGVCTGIYTGLFFDETVNAYRYAQLGELASGWQQIGDYWHYFDSKTKVAVTGDYYYASRGITYHFDETGKTEGVWQKTSSGTRFWYGAWYYTAKNNYQQSFIEIDGKTYNFDINGYLSTGIHALYADYTSIVRGEMNIWEFDKNGVLIGQIIEKGLINNKRGGMYLVEEDGYVHGNAGAVEYNGDIYFVNYSGLLKIDGFQTINKANSNGLLKVGSYYFGENGKLFTGTKKGTDGILYYYNDGKLCSGIYNNELVEINGDIYLVKWSGKVASNETREITTVKANGLLKAGTYYFDESGKCYLGTGIKNGPDGIPYYYKDGKIYNGVYHSELVEVNGDIYLVKWSGKVASNETREITAVKANGLLKAGTYYFGKDGKLFTGIKNGPDGIPYYYKDGKIYNGVYHSELVEVNGDTYLVKWSGKVASNETRKITTVKANGLLKAGTYYFGEDGKLFTGVKEDTDGIQYYYKDGKIYNGVYHSELVEVNGDIYLVKWSGKVAANETREITKEKANGLLKAGTYYFGEDGKLVTKK